MGYWGRIDGWAWCLESRRGRQEGKLCNAAGGFLRYLSIYLYDVLVAVINGRCNR
jgi:hypothetical protein